MTFIVEDKTCQMQRYC